MAYDTVSGELIQQAWRDAGGDAGQILHIDHDTGTYLLQRDSVANGTERRFIPEVVEVIDRACLIEDGVISFSGTPAQMLHDQHVIAFYLGQRDRD